MLVYIAYVEACIRRVAGQDPTRTKASLFGNFQPSNAAQACPRKTASVRSRSALLLMSETSYV